MLSKRKCIEYVTKKIGNLLIAHFRLKVCLIYTN